MDVKYSKNGFFELKDAIKFIKSDFFPFYRKIKNYKYSIILGLGGNVGKVKQRFDKIFQILSKDRRFYIAQSSPIVLNKAFGFTKQDDFLNAVLFLQTNLHPKEVLKIMLNLELKFKRKRPFKNAPRTIDLDILYTNIKIKSKRLIVPHPGVNERISVILPLGLMRL
ncbi:2-amino-4-hydroxy-6-hydroxymethyldihydropteridine diphosphokinase [Campylobacter sputorum]|uniref:2-amino-4-hydroxy-6- hydroxymethyldihydropteridine diphosphokinase n=1 Tax=Campylobacter sputorum TaxID=206 RepID=UPI000B788386|nr:2-amino-4-hydroxy-6-hydroxymethyldihydropteridine diphosphokinase [Campylobacter sputorum]ASM36465.1 6-hydroxymethyl-7,8-dihydropterin pyrophosphokinase [Campylobacter sputorum bv. faecalis CCUG 20703]